MEDYFPRVTSNLHVGGCWHYCSYLILCESPSWPFPCGCQIATLTPRITFILKKKGTKKRGILVQLYLFLLSRKAYSFPEDVSISLLESHWLGHGHMATCSAKEAGKSIFSFSGL